MFENIKQDHKEKIIELVKELLEFYKEDDWLILKKYLLRYLHPDIRKYFSTRNSVTKKHKLNDFELSLIEYINNNYRHYLELKEKDTHRS
tara:strand:- start:415 stop:684 length:270 start_codon:yes stop_codon:yes gene_type:complete